LSNFFADYTGQFAALGAACLWAMASVSYRRLGRHFPPMGLNLAKGCVAIVLLTTTLLLTGGLTASVEPYAVGLLLASGALGIGLGDTALFNALNRLGPRRTLLFMILAPPLTAILSRIFLGEAMGLGAWLGLAVTVGGVAWVVTERSPGSPEHPRHLWAGVGFGLVFASAQAGGMVLSRAVQTQTDTVPLYGAALRILGGIVFLLIWIAAMRQPLRQWVRHFHGRRLWRVLIITSFGGTFLAIWLAQIAVDQAPAGIAQTLLSTSPLFVLPVVILLGEKVSLRAVLGALVGIGGIALLFCLG